MSRTTREVLDDHLHLRAVGDLDGDLARNYADDVVFLCRFGVLRGREGVRASADRLALQLPGARFEYLSCVVHDEHALLLWRAESETSTIEDGADSYVVRDGRICLQTIHYRVVPSE